MLQAHLFSNFTARILVIFHSTFSKKSLSQALRFTYKPPSILISMNLTHYRHDTTKLFWFNVT